MSVTKDHIINSYNGLPKTQSWVDKILNVNWPSEHLKNVAWEVAYHIAKIEREENREN